MVVVAVVLSGLSGLAAAAGPLPSGERIIGGHGSSGGTVVEPVYDDMTGQIRYVSTPRGTPNPVKSNPRATAPFYLPVFPVGSTIGVTLNCQDVPIENCPDHGPAVAAAAQAIMPSVYGVGVIGHDHLMAGPGSHGDFNVAWVPTLVLFTNSAAANTHITTLAQINAMLKSGDVITIPLDGTNGTPNLTFHCSVVSAPVYAHGTRFLRPDHRLRRIRGGPSPKLGPPDSSDARPATEMGVCGRFCVDRQARVVSPVAAELGCGLHHRLEEAAMAVGLRIKFEGGTQEQYEATSSRLRADQNPPEGLIFHSAGPIEGGWGLIEFWDSREAFDRFVESRLGPAAHELGDRTFTVPPDIKEFPVHNIIKP